MEIQHQSEEVDVVNNIEHRYQARLVILDELMDEIFTAIYDIYNFLALEKWEQILPQDLDTIKPVLESLRNFHCPLNHNEDMTHRRDTRRVTWIEFHHTIFDKIRDSIPIYPKGKIHYDFVELTERYTKLIQHTEKWLHAILNMQLGENFYVRVKLYQQHQKALHFKCPLLHTHSIVNKLHLPPAEGSLRIAKTMETERLFHKIMLRACDLLTSFQDEHHYLHTAKEPLPHPDFLTYL